MTLTVGGGREGAELPESAVRSRKWGKAGEGNENAGVDLPLFNGSTTLYPCSHTQSVSRNDDAPLIWPLFRESSLYLSVSAVCMFTHFHLRTGAYRTFMLAHRERGRRICVPTTRRSVCADKHANHARRKQQRWSQGNHLTLLCKSGNNPNSLVPKFTQHSSLQTERLHYFF